MPALMLFPRSVESANGDGRLADVADEVTRVDTQTNMDRSETHAARSMAWIMRPTIHAITGGVTALPASFT